MQDFLDKMRQCSLCGLRQTCQQVVLPVGNLKDPILMIVGEAPGGTEDQVGEPFVGDCGQILREVLRRTEILNRDTTAIVNTINCRPPGNKYPKDRTVTTVCTNTWLFPLIDRLNPKRLLLLGSRPLKAVAGLDGITKIRGTWRKARGIRSMPTYHPSYVMRKDGEGDLYTRRMFIRDIMEVAEEVREINAKQQAEDTPPSVFKL